MTRRLFIGIRIPDDLHQRLAALQSGVRGAAWVAPENFHVTLDFLGDVEESRLGDLHGILAGVGGTDFALTLAGTGSFGSRAPKLLWAGLARSPALEELQKKVAGRLGRTGFTSQTRKYSPHVTLAYMRGGRGTKAVTLAPWIERTAAFQAAPFEVTGFALMESRTGSGGSHYIDLQDYPFGS